MLPDRDVGPRYLQWNLCLHDDEVLAGLGRTFSLQRSRHLIV
jgi:hypothetical protein